MTASPESAEERRSLLDLEAGASPQGSQQQPSPGRSDRGGGGAALPAGGAIPADHFSPIADLAAHKKTEAELESLLAHGVPNATGPRASRRHRAAVHNYYTHQNELIDLLLETQQIHRGQYTNNVVQEEAEARRALDVSFASNCLLLVVRLALAVVSGSLSLMVATLDAVLDVVSSGIMFYTTWQAKRKNKYQYPVGKERMEPLGIVVFSVIMGTAGFTVIGEAVRQLLSPSPQDMPMMWLVIGGTIGVVLMKLGLFLYCRGSPSSAVQAFALDHLNDVLVNGVGLAGALLGARVAMYWDPTIAILLSVWVVWAWGDQARQHILNLVGRAAPPYLLQRLTYLTYYHDPRVQYIDTVRAYTLGNTYVAEVDIVLPEQMPLREAHDIGESLQIKLELLPEVTRAHVHLDYETTHAPEH